ncbi:MAG: hypothetical protein HY718_08100 [Planctomycetes bacterium]|nr:hypothetical protein [Planctomycetota bacterium]
MVVSTGLLFGVHTSYAQADHDAQHCNLCLALTHPAPAVVGAVSLAPIGEAAADFTLLPVQKAPASIEVHRGLGSRAPPHVG